MKLHFPLSKKSRSLRTSFLLSFITFITLCSFSGHATGAEISGTVFLPNDQTAPAGGVSVRVSFHDNRGTPGYGTGYFDVLIPEGSSSGSFIFETPDITAALWYVRYMMMDNFDTYFAIGYYSTAGATPDRYSATLLPSAQNHANIDITLLRAITISGFIDAQNIEYGSLSVTCNVIDSSSNILFSKIRTTYTPPHTYSVTVPVIADTSFQVKYNYFGDNYISTGYYSLSGTTWNQAEATLLEGGKDHAGIDMSLLPGKAILGNVSGNTVNDIGDWEVEISAQDVNGIAYGDSYRVSSSGNYILRVPDAAGSSWRVNYQFHCTESYDDYYTDCQFGAVETGYYALTGTTWSKAEATLLAGGQNHSGINLSYLPGNSITGTISVPSSYIGQFGDQIMIYAEDMNGKVSRGYIPRRNVNIYGYPASISYNLNVPNTSTASWLIKVHSPYSPFIKDFFYAANGTTWKISEASQLAGGHDYSGIDLTFLLEKPVYEAPFLPGILKSLLSID